MTDKIFDEKYAEYQSYFNAQLDKVLSEISTVPPILAESMKYSLLLGGKRIRPVLAYAVGDILGVSREKITPFVCAIEFIHTYSLIHDDLPDMDNDDYRRGKPSNHKVFGAGNAILAGDGLLNTAYSILFAECFKGCEYISAGKFICDCAGIYGMLAGQSADMAYENAEGVDEDALEYVYDNKTAKLILAPILVPSILKAGAFYSQLKVFGEKLGFLFQLTDDLLDATGSFSKLGKTTGKDEAEGKLTAVKIYGIEKSRLLVDFIGDECHKVLDGVQGDVSFLHCLVNFVKSRVF